MDVSLDLVSQTQTPVPKRDEGDAALLDNGDAAADIDSKHALHIRKDLHPLSVDSRRTRDRGTT